MTQLFLDGRWVPAAGGGTRAITCPADGSDVGTVAEATEDDTLAAIAAARHAFDAGPWPGTPVAERAALYARQAIGRMVTPEEVAGAVAYLASPLSGSTTGTALEVDGGVTHLRIRPE